MWGAPRNCRGGRQRHRDRVLHVRLQRGCRCCERAVRDSETFQREDTTLSERTLQHHRESIHELHQQDSSALPLRRLSRHVVDGFAGQDASASMSVSGSTPTRLDTLRAAYMYTPRICEESMLFNLICHWRATNWKYIYISRTPVWQPRTLISRLLVITQ